MSFIPIYLLILLFTIVIDYYAGIYIDRSLGKKRKLFLVISLITNIGILAFFKYFNFFNENLSALLTTLGVQNPIPFLNIILPIGLSFHTFQAMSYTIEVYRGNQKPETNFGIYALYVMFYPQLVAGPIERPQNLLYQFYEEKSFNYERFLEGMKLMIWGLFKKIVIADRLSIYVDAVYNNPTHHHSLTLMIATILFAFQIYCDFSGYSEMAIGAAHMMGFKLMTNFNRPYFSTSISEFWKRWHISLSTWFTDYLYISMGGNRVSIPRWYFNLFFVFLISGLWHGANWTFIIWGALNGFYLIAALVIKNNLKLESKINYPFKKQINVLFTFSLICITWVFFRANSVGDGLFILKSFFNYSGGFFNGGWKDLIFGVFGVLFLLIIESIQVHDHLQKNLLPFKSKLPLMNQVFYTFLIIAICLFGVFDGGQFIYFQF